MFCSLLADFQQAQMMMVAGFVMLGWVLARRQLRLRKRVNADTRVANKELQKVRNQKMPSLPLSDAPAETQRWQVALFDLQRELKAELDTRIVIVQTLLRQVDQRIDRLSKLQGSDDSSILQPKAALGIASEKVDQVELLVHEGYTAEEIAQQVGLPVGDIEMTIAMLRV